MIVLDALSRSRYTFMGDAATRLTRFFIARSLLQTRFCTVHVRLQVPCTTETLCSCHPCSICRCDPNTVDLVWTITARNSSRAMRFVSWPMRRSRFPSTYGIVFQNVQNSPTSPALWVGAASTSYWLQGGGLQQIPAIACSLATLVGNADRGAMASPLPHSVLLRISA